MKIKTRNKISFNYRVAGFMLFCSVFLLSSSTLVLAEDVSSNTPRIAISWMRSWATAGQVMEAMTRTNIPSLYHSHATFPNFLFGPQMNEAALSGSVDGTNTGVVPTVSLLAASDAWVVVARLVDFEVSTVARKGSKIEHIRDLRGKKVGVPFGGGSHPYIIQRLNTAGLQIGTGQTKVTLINIKPSEQPLALEAGNVDAIGTWEPQTTITTGRGYGKVIDSFRHNGFVTVRKELVEKHPEEIVALLKAYVEAHYFVAMHHDQTDQWFAQTSGYELPLVKSIHSIEANHAVKDIKKISISITDKDIELANGVARTMYDSGMIRENVDFGRRVDASFVDRALKSLAKEGYKTAEVKAGK